MNEDFFSNIYRRGKIIARLSLLISLVKKSRTRKEKLERRKRRKRFFLLVNYYYYKSADLAEKIIIITKPN